MTNPIIEAQYILDHPDELVSAKAYREVIEGLLKKQSPEILEALELAYIYMVDSAHDAHRALNQQSFCKVRDAIAKVTSHTSEEVQNMFERNLDERDAIHIPDIQPVDWNYRLKKFGMWLRYHHLD